MFHKYNIYYFIDNFNRQEIESLDKNICIIFRNYSLTNIEPALKALSLICIKKKNKLFISNNLKLAKKYDLDGLYIPSFNKKKNYKNINIKKNFRIIGSAHNIQQIIIKVEQGCDEIFISPLFKTKKNKKFLDIINFNLINLFHALKVVALGGINETNIKKLKLTKASGFGSIEWVKKNRPNKLGRLI